MDVIQDVDFKVIVLPKFGRLISQRTPTVRCLIVPVPCNLIYYIIFIVNGLLGDLVGRSDLETFQAATRSTLQSGLFSSNQIG